MALAAAFGGCVGGGDDEPGRAEMALSHGSEDPVALVEIGLDSTSYAEVVDRLGAAPGGVVDLGPRTSGAATVRIEMSPGTPTALFAESVRAAREEGPVPSDLDLSIGNEGQAIGLLLPAVQKFTSMGTDTDDHGQPTLFVQMQTDGPIIDDLQAPPQAIDSFFDISYDLVATATAMPGATPEERAAIDALPNPVPVDGALVLVPVDGALLLDSEVRLRYGDAETPRDVLERAPRLSVAFDLRDESTAPLHRIRALGAVPLQGGAGLDILIGNTGGDHNVITFTGLEYASTDADGVRSLFLDEYADYDTSMFGRAETLLQPVLDLMETDPEGALLLWHGGISPTGETIEPSAPQILGVLVDLLIDTVDREAMACSVGMPFSIEAGQAMDAPPYELAAILEEAAAAGDIMANFREQLSGSGDDVIFGGLGQDDVMDEPTVPCDAVIATAQVLADGPVDGLSPAKRDALIRLGLAIKSSRAAYLTRLIIELDQLMDEGAQIDDLLGSAWPAAAKTKACILIESLGNMAQAAGETHTVATELLSLN